MPSETRTPKTMRDRRSRPNRSVPKGWRSEEHTSELQSQSNLVCRLLLEKKKKQRELPGAPDWSSALKLGKATVRIQLPVRPQHLSSGGKGATPATTHQCGILRRGRHWS